MPIPDRRQRRDAALVVLANLPAASEANTTTPFDIGSGPFNPEEIAVEVSIPAMPLHVTPDNVLTLTLWAGDTADALAPLDGVELSFSIPGVADTGSAAFAGSLKLPPGTKRYVAFHQEAGATDDLSGYAVTCSILN